MIGVGVNDYLQVKVRLNEFVNDKFLAAPVSFIQVDSADQRFQGVAEDNLLKLGILLIVLYNGPDSDLARQVVE